MGSVPIFRGHLSCPLASTDIGCTGLHIRCLWGLYYCCCHSTCGLMQLWWPPQRVQPHPQLNPSACQECVCGNFRPHCCCKVILTLYEKHNQEHLCVLLLMREEAAACLLHLAEQHEDMDSTRNRPFPMLSEQNSHFLTIMAILTSQISTPFCFCILWIPIRFLYLIHQKCFHIG